MKITILAFDGTESIAATEWELTTDTAFAAQASTLEGEWQANIDINNFTGAETAVFRVYEKMRTSASAQRLMYEFTLSVAALVNAKGWQSPKFTLGNGWAMTLQLTSGTTKTVIWSIHRWQSGPTAAEVAAIQADTDDIQTRLPAALVSGRMDSSVGAMAAAVITAASIATDAFTAAKFAANAGTEIAAAVWDALTSTITTASSIGKLLVDNVNATISSRASQTSVDTIDDFVDTEVAAIKAKTDNLPTDPADASDIAASFASLNTKVDTIDDFLDTEIAAIKAKTDNLPADPADASDIAALFAAIPAAVWDRLTSALTTVGSAGKLLVDNLNATVSSRASQTSVDTIDDFVDTEVAAIKAKTDNLPSDPADASDIAALFAAVPAAVWDRLTSALTVVGSAGKLLVDNVNATISSRASQTSVDTIDDFVDTEVAAIKAKTDNLPSDPADASDIAAAFASLNTKVDTIDDFLDTEVAAIKAKTDNLPTDPADASDIAGAFASLNTKVDTIDDFLDTEVAAIKAKTDNLPSDPADASDIAGAFAALPAIVRTQADDALDAYDAPTRTEATADKDEVLAAVSAVAVPTADENADALLDRVDAVETGLTFRGALRVMSSILFGKVSDAGTNVETFRNAVADTKDRAVITSDVNGNRTDVATDLT